jgi:sigma-B regulation protein RsbU (phosphoserine phosphatase)
MFGSEQFGTTRLQLDPGDALLIFTDGVIDAEDAAGSPYGLERVARVAERAHGLEPAGIVDACSRDLAAFVNGTTYSDDVTMMALRRTAGH